ncbi:hypothetical protein GCM10020255_040840 [Rhodococcus baikonurensis]
MDEVQNLAFEHDRAGDSPRHRRARDVVRPSHVAFALSKDSLEAVAADCQKSLENQTIGVYRVLQVWPVGNGCRFHIEGGLIDSIGLAYLPDGAPYLGKPRHDGDIGYQEFDGDWYSFVQRF